MSRSVEDKGRKGKHVTLDEKMAMHVLCEAGYTPYRIGQLIGRAPDTVSRVLKGGRVRTGTFEKASAAEVEDEGTEL